MLRYIQDVRAVRGMGRVLSDHHVVLCKVRLMSMWIKRRGERWRMGQGGLEVKN